MIHTVNVTIWLLHNVFDIYKTKLTLQVSGYYQHYLWPSLIVKLEAQNKGSSQISLRP